MLLLLVEQLAKLAAISGKNDKLAYLGSGELSQLTIDVLRFLANPMIVTGIATKKLQKQLSLEPTQTFDDVNALLDYVSENNTGSDEVIANVQYFINAQPVEAQDTLQKIVTKTYKVGATANTLNKAFGEGFIKQFKIQLAQSYAKRADKLKDGVDEIAITTKLDGFRCIAFSDRDPHFFTRTGREIKGLADIERELSYFADFDIVLDGELLITETTSDKAEWFNETSKILSRDGEKTNVTYWVFDGFTASKFDKQEETVSYKERRKALEETFELVDFKHIKLLPVLYQGTDHSMIDKLYAEAVSQGEEGIMVNLNSSYEYKRTNNLLKVKPVDSADLEIVGFEAGGKNTKFENTLGAIVVDYQGVRVSVGSGLSDEMRDEIWNNQSDYLGKVVEIHYTSVSTNKNNDDLNLRFPRFKTIRTDKTLDDLNIE